MYKSEHTLDNIGNPPHNPRTFAGGRSVHRQLEKTLMTSTNVRKPRSAVAGLLLKAAYDRWSWEECLPLVQDIVESMSLRSSIDFAGFSPTPLVDHKPIEGQEAPEFEFDGLRECLAEADQVLERGVASELDNLKDRIVYELDALYLRLAS